MSRISLLEASYRTQRRSVCVLPIRLSVSFSSTCCLQTCVKTVGANNFSAPQTYSRELRALDLTVPRSVLLPGTSVLQLLGVFCYQAPCSWRLLGMVGPHWSRSSEPRRVVEHSQEPRGPTPLAPRDCLKYSQEPSRTQGSLPFSLL